MATATIPVYASGIELDSIARAAEPIYQAYMTAAALWGGGLAQGSTIVAGSTAETTTTHGEGFGGVLGVAHPFLVVALVGLVAYATAQAVFAGHLFATLAGVRTIRPEALAPSHQPEPAAAEEE